MSRTIRKCLTDGNHREARKGTPSMKVGKRVQVERPIYAPVKQPSITAIIAAFDQHKDVYRYNAEIKAYWRWIEEGRPTRRIVGYQTKTVSKNQGYIDLPQGKDKPDRWGRRRRGGTLMSLRNTGRWDDETASNSKARNEERRHYKRRERQQVNREIMEEM